MADPISSPSTDPVTTWDSIAPDFYRAFPPAPQRLSYGPLVAGENDLKLLGSVTGKRILDLGCGAGFGSIALAKSGAHVIAVDFSAQRLQIARRLAEREEARVEFRQAGLSELIFIPADSIDIVVSAWSLNFTQEWSRVFRAVSRVLAPSGIFVLSVEHPIWSCLDQTTGALSRPYRDGYSAPRQLIPGDPASTTEFYSYTIGGTVSSLMKEGFTVHHLFELPAIAPPTDPWYKVYAPELARNLPPVLLVKCGL
ncbi:MAG: hypothetical protein C4318_01065 [Acidimicrobiia bacterium]